MKFEVRLTEFFTKQVEKLSNKEKRVILEKNPFRFKKLIGYKNTFEIKVTIQKITHD